MNISHVSYASKTIIKKSLRGVMSNIADYGFEINELKLQTHQYAFSRINTLGKGMNLLISIAMRLIVPQLLWIELPWPENPPNTYAREHWIDVSTLLGLISSIYRNLHHRRSNQRQQIAVPKLNNCANSSYCIQATPNQRVMVIARPNNLNMSCKLHPYSFQRTRSPHPLGPRLPKKLRNMHPRNYYTSGARE